MTMPSSQSLGQEDLGSLPMGFSTDRSVLFSGLLSSSFTCTLIVLGRPAPCRIRGPYPSTPLEQAPGCRTDPTPPLFIGHSVCPPNSAPRSLRVPLSLSPSLLIPTFPFSLS